MVFVVGGGVEHEANESVDHRIVVGMVAVEEGHACLVKRVSSRGVKRVSSRGVKRVSSRGQSFLP